MPKTLIVAVLLTAGLTACAPTSRFEWGNYDTALYAYAKNPEARASYRQALVTAIERGRATNRVAPGLLAELGYLYLEEGNRVEAVRYFEEEARLFPESAPFMTGVISKVNAGASSAEVQSMKEGAVS